MKGLIERAKEKLRELQLGGIVRDLRTTADSHCIVTYPDSSEAYKITQEEIFEPSQDLGYLALYFHIPFCVNKCTFCQYTSYPGKNEAEINKYLSVIKNEMRIVTRLLATRNPRITSVYIGGGTPTSLSPKSLEGLLNCIQNSFDLSAVAEFTVEGSPDTILNEMGRQRLDILKRHRVSRLNVGVQTLDNNILSMIRRNYNSQQAIDSLEEAKKICPDRDDVPYFALALKFNIPIWSNDKKLKEQNKIKVYSTQDILNLLSYPPNNNN